MNTLTNFVAGIVKSGHVRLAEVAAEIPNAGKEESKIMQLRRRSANIGITADVYYLPFLRSVLAGIFNAGGPFVLIIDGSVSGRGCIALMISVLYKRRALPLIWITRKGKKGHFPETAHIELIKAVHKIIPAGREVICLGDGEFDGIDWLDTIARFGWTYVCRTAKDSVCYEEERFKIQDICPPRGGRTGISGVGFTDRKYGPVTAIAWHGHKYKEPIYLVSNFTLPGEACFWYKKRFIIETMFSDFKSRGFQLHKSGLSDPERVSRLLTAVSLAYIWLVYLGEFALESGWSKCIHRTERCDLSVFQLGKRLLKRFLRERLKIPEIYFNVR